MWSVQACWALLLATSVLHRGHGAVLAEEKKEATEDWEGWPVYMEGCYLAFLDGGMSKEDTGRFYQSVEQEANRGLNVTKMAELHEATSGFVFMGDNESAEVVSRMPGVSKVIPDYAVIGQSAPWHLDRIDQRCGPRDKHNYLPDKNGTGVDIYVIDSGANFNYSDIKDRLVYPGVDFIDKVHGENQEGVDCNGHGTHINSLAAGTKYGVAPGANVIVIRILDCNNYGPFSAVLMGMELVLKMYKQRGNPAVASMSFLAPAAQELDRAVESLITAGVVAVVAAGNQRLSSCNYSPSRVSRGITVGATRENGDGVYWFSEHDDSPGSNYGPCVDMFAPGQWIYSAGLDCRDCEIVKSGTSMATPLVSGAVALLLQEHPSLTPAEIKVRVLQMSTNMVINFTQLSNKTLALETPNRLLFVKRQDGIEGTCVVTEPTATMSTVRTSTPHSPTHPTPPLTDVPTSPPPSEAPTSPSTPPSQPTTTPPTRLPQDLHLRGTVISKPATESCVGEPLDSQSLVVYDSLPKDKVVEYHSTFFERGYTLTYLTSFRSADYEESRYITIFAKTTHHNTIPRLKMNLRDMVIASVKLRSLKYYFKNFVTAKEVDLNRAESSVYSGILVKDSNIISQQMNPVAASFVLQYLHPMNGSAGVRTNREVQQVSAKRMTNGQILYYVVWQRVRRPHRKSTLLSVTLTEAKHAINVFLNQGQYLESFQSYWHSASVMRYNLIFTDKAMGSCNHKVIMDTNRSSMAENRRVLIKNGWIPTMISTHRSEGTAYLRYITVWWK